MYVSINIYIYTYVLYPLHTHDMQPVEFPRQRRVAEGRQGAHQATHHVSGVADAIVSAPGLDLALLQ